MKKENKNDKLMTFGGHLEVLRQMLFRIIGITTILMVVIFYFKAETWNILLWPTNSDFILYQVLQHWIDEAGINMTVNNFHVDMISTDLSSQFMTHVSTSLYIALVLASPYIVFEIYSFISPALYDNERKGSKITLIAVYILFFIGLAVNYFIILPLSFRFLGTYQVAPSIKINITLDSYISMFLSLSLIMGLIFQMPVLSYFMAKFGLIKSSFLTKYRRHAIVLIVLLSAIITPPDLFSCIVVSIPLYALFEISIQVTKKVEVKDEQNH
ncbi:twin-arginine translocase subunit TatC [Prevotella sp. AGR2160]|uniref:twin-arginine translocase subunit TatC n=1 Tax=Prevotella sp. AGR2160 TaxID=1280674 RepID=UPI00048A57F0|nr:twin-arginine translocase subunit TatC [Prevotella sp. AGR2160]